MKWIKAVVALAFIFVFAVLGIFYFNQEKVVFFPEVLPTDFQFQFSAPFKENNLKLASGGTINYLIFNQSSSKGSILYFHGNAGSLRTWGQVASEIAKNTELSVWIMDFPGYGKSSGPLPKNEKLLVEMSNAIRNEISQTMPNLPIVAFGRSVGTGVATNLAAMKLVNALILETPYKSLAKLAHEIFPFLPEFISRFDLDNERQLPLTGSMPVLILHGTSDRVIPYSHGKHLSVLKQIQFISIQGGEHNNLSEFPEYWPAVETFMNGIK